VPLFNTSIQGDISLNSGFQNLASRNEEHPSIVWREVCFNTLKRLSVDHRCDRQRDRRTDIPIANAVIHYAVRPKIQLSIVIQITVTCNNLLFEILDDAGICTHNNDNNINNSKWYSQMSMNICLHTPVFSLMVALYFMPLTHTPETVAINSTPDSGASLKLAQPRPKAGLSVECGVGIAPSHCEGPGVSSPENL